ncbi:MAG: hypothetical protein A2Y91_06105 [Chloroflexi bacterium RBG_13_54_8]|nr:MAG: hypothetical protein A2Y91_06105 [Chloroflexi bacterium RBG_13_54_8]
MRKSEEEIVEKWQRSCVLLNNCRGCPDAVECLKLAENVQKLRLLSLWKREGVQRTRNSSLSRSFNNEHADNAR